MHFNYGAMKESSIITVRFSSLAPVAAKLTCHQVRVTDTDSSLSGETSRRSSDPIIQIPHGTSKRVIIKNIKQFAGTTVKQHLPRGS